MLIRRFLFLLLLAAAVVSCAEEEPEQGRIATVRETGGPSSEPPRNENVPLKAVRVYEHVLRTGRAPQGYVGGRAWQNREHRLQRNGTYREYDVNPKISGRNRGPERVVFDVVSGKGWYTPDHYRTFFPITARNHEHYSP